MKLGKPLLLQTRFLDLVRERIRYLHYSLNTENLRLVGALAWAIFRYGRLFDPDISVGVKS